MQMEVGLLMSSNKIEYEYINGETILKMIEEKENEDKVHQ